MGAVRQFCGGGNAGRRGRGDGRDMNADEYDVNLYSRPPAGFRNGIPYFSEPTLYAENYEQVYNDHFEGARDNLMPEEIWVSLDDSTCKMISLDFPSRVRI